MKSCRNCHFGEYRVSSGRLTTLCTLKKKSPISAYHTATERKRAAMGYKEKHSAKKRAVGSENGEYPPMTRYRGTGNESDTKKWQHNISYTC